MFKATLLIMAPRWRHHRCPLSGKQVTQCGVPTRLGLSDRKNGPRLSSATQMTLRTTIPSKGSQTEQKTCCLASFFCSFRRGKTTDCAVRRTRVALARRQDEARWGGGNVLLCWGCFCSSALTKASTPSGWSLFVEIIPGQKLM